MVDSISSCTSTFSMSQLQQTAKKPPSAEDMFSRLTEDVGGDGSTITKDQLDSYIESLGSSDSEDKGKLGFLKQLQSNWDEISGGEDSISVDDLENGMDLLKPPQGGPPPMGAMGSASGVSSISDLNSTLLESLLSNNSDSSSSYSLYNWQDPSTVTKEQLQSPINLLI